MSRPDRAVFVLVHRHGREAVPTLRSILECVTSDEITVVCAHDTGGVVRGWAREAAPGIRVLDVDGEDRSDALAAVLADDAGEAVAVVDAGDLVDARWLAQALDRAASSSVMARPADIVTFGRRSGHRLQASWAGEPADLRALARLDLWSGPFAVARSAVARVAAPRGPDGDRRWVLDVLAAGVHQDVLSGTAAFVRVWDGRAPWEPRDPLLAPTALLTDQIIARTAPRPTGVAARPGRPLRTARLAVRCARSIARPWVRGIRKLLPHRRTTERFSETLRREWRRANALEPLIPFPRADVDAWYERGDTIAAHILREIDAYWDLVADTGAHVDHLYFAPWVQTGGGDAVLRHYVETVAALRPEGVTAVVTTEPVASTRADALRATAPVIELKPHLDAGVHRDAFVDWIVPQLIAQLTPRTVHAFNSTVAFDVIEKRGSRLSETSSLFLSSFAVDRSDDGEALSVLFLRSPDFLAPVSAVLVDSAQYVDRMVREHGHPREKFVVQRTAIRDREERRADSGRLAVFWAGRFDTPKRLDVLADVAELVRANGLEIDIHVYGEAVMGDPGLKRTLDRLDAAAVARHPPFRRFDDLPLEDYAAYVLTSEWEGVPLTLLDALSVAMPVIAPDVGGVGEIVDESTGDLIERFDDARAYVRALENLFVDRGPALERARAGRERVRAEFSQSAFVETLVRVGYEEGTAAPAEN